MFLFKSITQFGIPIKIYTIETLPLLEYSCFVQILYGPP